MLLRFILAISLICGSVLMGFCAETSPQWQQEMRGLEHQLLQLMLDASSERRFHNPENLARIESNTKRMAELSHKLQNTTHTALAPGDVPDDDPTLPLVSKLFAQDMDHAVAALGAGHLSYARSKILSSTGYCMSCHTRNNTGPQFDTALNLSSFDELTTLERANIYTASRQFDLALATYQAIVRNKARHALHPLEWEQALRNALVLTVRVKQDPSVTLRLLKSALRAPQLSHALRADIIHWQLATKKWQQERHVEPSIALAERIFQEALGVQSYLNDRRADIQFLRVTNILHTLLEDLNAPNRHRALFMLGRSYEALRDLELWTLHELYYDACIRETPHSTVAKQCYQHIEDSMHANYTGSAGVNLPQTMRRKLRELKKLAQ